MGTLKNKEIFNKFWRFVRNKLPEHYELVLGAPDTSREAQESVTAYVQHKDSMKSKAVVELTVDTHHCSARLGVQSCPIEQSHLDIQTDSFGFEEMGAFDPIIKELSDWLIFGRRRHFFYDAGDIEGEEEDEENVPYYRELFNTELEKEKS